MHVRSRSHGTYTLTLSVVRIIFPPFVVGGAGILVFEPLLVPAVDEATAADVGLGGSESCRAWVSID